MLGLPLAEVTHVVKEMHGDSLRRLNDRANPAAMGQTPFIGGQPRLAVGQDFASSSHRANPSVIAHDIAQDG